MDMYLRARGVVSVFMTDDALGGGGSFWSGAWLGWNQVGPSSLWSEERAPPHKRSQPQLHPEENCGVATGGERAGKLERAARPNNNPTLTATKKTGVNILDKMDEKERAATARIPNNNPTMDTATKRPKRNVWMKTEKMLIVRIVWIKLD